jgi:spectinomycin phosphotransferase
MLDRPPLTDKQLLNAVRQTYGLVPTGITFLPLGYDANAGVFRLETAHEPYFLKVKRSPLEPISLRLPHYLRGHGLPEAVAPIPGLDGALHGEVGDYGLILYPFITDSGAKPVGAQWVAFGGALKRLHSTPPPPDLLPFLRREDFIPGPRDVQIIGRMSLGMADRVETHPVRAAFRDFWLAHQGAINQMLERAEALGEALRAEPPPLALCHADIHTGNLMVDSAGSLHIVDWDQPMLAPVERDLLFVTGGVFWTTPAEEDLFFQGYGPVNIQARCLAYFRYARAVEEVAAFAVQILESDSSDAALADALGWFRAQFAPAGILEAAGRLWAINISPHAFQQARGQQP